MSAQDLPVRVLVIEGEPAVRKGLTVVLSKDVFKVAAVANYFEALWHFGEFKPDLVILNERLPMMSGWDACCLLHQNFGIPVIVLGVDQSNEAWVKAWEAGADFYLRVPFSHLELVARAKTVIRRYKKRQLTQV